MKHFKFLFCMLVTIAWIVSPALAETAPDFSPGQYLCIDNVPITGDNSYSATEVADWNADGKKDLLVGVFYEGNIWLFLNQETSEEPLFTEGTLLEADGVPISVGYG